MGKEIRPRNMELEHGRIEFNDLDPATCNQCGSRIHEEIVNVRTYTGKGPDRTWFYKALMCDCRVIPLRGSSYERPGHDPQAWIQDGDDNE